MDYDIKIDGVICHISGTNDMVDGRICKVFPGLDPNTEHTYGVRANNDEGSSRFSTQETITTAISKNNGLGERSTDSTYTDGKISYTGNDPVNVITGAFLWSYTYLEDYGKDKLHFTLMYDSDRDAFGKAVGVKWSYALHYCIWMRIMRISAHHMGRLFLLSKKRTILSVRWKLWALPIRWSRGRICPMPSLRWMEQSTFLIPT